MGQRHRVYPTRLSAVIMPSRETASAAETTTMATGAVSVARFRRLAADDFGPTDTLPTTGAHPSPIVTATPPLRPHVTTRSTRNNKQQQEQEQRHITTTTLTTITMEMIVMGATPADVGGGGGVGNTADGWARVDVTEAAVDAGRWPSGSLDPLQLVQPVGRHGVAGHGGRRVGLVSGAGPYLSERQHKWLRVVGRGLDGVR